MVALADMAALQATEMGPWQEVLQLAPPPEIPPTGDGQLRLRVLCAGLAFPDVLEIEGVYQTTHEYPYTPGVEVSGEITEVGAGVKGFAVGDRVFGAPVGGALKPVALMEASRAHKIPDGVDPAIPAGFEMNYGTAYHALHDLAQVQAGERVLVLGASGGVGMAAVDLACAAGAEVVACASSAEKLRHCAEAGATTLINYEEDAGGDFKEALREAGIYPQIDVVVDVVG